MQRFKRSNQRSKESKQRFCLQDFKRILTKSPIHFDINAGSVSSVKAKVEGNFTLRLSRFQPYPGFLTRMRLCDD